VSVNNYLPHVIVLPEDDDNRQLANGFTIGTHFQRRLQILPVAGGWLKVVRQFQQSHVNRMREFCERRFVLLLDFDGDEFQRRNDIEAEIPEDLRSRVFLLGVAKEPKDLRAESGQKLEAIGETLARECAENEAKFWNHPLLQHNELELERLRADVHPFLFS